MIPTATTTNPVRELAMIPAIIPLERFVAIRCVSVTVGAIYVLRSDI